jgi:hypothetical protein
MLKITTTVILALLTTPAFAQTAITPTERSDVSRETTPIIRVAVVGRTTVAINYRPRSGGTKVDFAGTTLLPEAHGYADVSGEKGYKRSMRASRNSSRQHISVPST